MAESIEGRVVKLEGGRNFRDLGGYPAADGRHVRWGQLFRSGSLHALTDGDWDALGVRGVRTVCDFRTDGERAVEPFPWAGRNDVRYWSGDCKASFAVLGEALRAGFASGEAARGGMIAGYRDLPFQLAPAYRQLFSLLTTGDIPLVFNCAAGKDRAGVGAALVLSALGVRRETVVEDYLLTNRIYDVEAALSRPREGRRAGHSREVRAAIARADPAYIEGALDEIEERCGGFEAFLGDFMSIDPGKLRVVRSRLLE